MNYFYHNTGALILGTRMKRLSEKFLQEINQVYKDENIPFEPSWFPIFYLLKNGEGRSLSEIAGELEVSHSAISQMVHILKKNGLLDELSDPYDKRRKNICLSQKGKSLLAQVKPVWWAMEQTLNDMLGEGNSSAFFSQLYKLERMVQQNKLSKKIIEQIPVNRFRLDQVADVKNDPALTSFLLEYGFAIDDHQGLMGKAVAEHEIVGFIHLLPLDSTDDYLLKDLFVKNGYRRKGLGAKLLEWGMDELYLDKKRSCLHLKKVSASLLELLLKKGMTFKVLGKTASYE